MKTIDKRLLRMIGDTKSQFAAVSVILAVGLAFYMSMGLAALNLRQGMERYYDEYRFADLSCQAGGVSLRQVRALEELPGVAEAEGRFTRTVPLLTEDADGRGRAEIVTVPAGNGGINRLLLEEGSLLQAGSRDVLVIRQLAAARDIRPGDRIRMQINGQAMEFPVAGIVSSPEFIYLADPDQGIMPDNKNYGVIYMEENFGRQLLGAQGGYNDIQILEENGLSGTERDDLAKTIEERLEDYGGQGAVQRAEQFSNVMISDEIGQLETMAAALPVLFLLIAALILVMMLGRMVKRDRQSIGILKGLGYSSAQVVSHYVKYSLLAGLAGGVAGAAAGMGLAGALTTYYMEFFFLPDLNRITDYQYIPQAILLSCLFCAAAGLLGTRGVFAVSPSESMKTESPGTGRRILLERARFLWRRLSFSQKLATKNVFRNKKRALFIFTGIMVTYGMMVFVLTMPAMLSDMMGKGLEEFQPMDYNVSFKAPLSEKALVDIRRIVGDVTELEGKVEYPFRLESGPRDIALTVIGVERGTAFYRFRGQDGRAYEVPEDGILLSGYAAKKLRAGVGDLVLLHAYLPGAEDVWAEVTGVIYQAMGVNAYMDKAAMARAYLTPGAVTGFYMNSGDPDAAGRLLELPAVRSVMSLAATKESFQEYTQVMNVTIFLLAGLAGLLGFAIVYNATIVSIGERETEFSVLRVLGFSRGEIFRLLLRENNMITAAGLIAGIPLAGLFLRYSSDVFSTEQYTMRLQAAPVHYAAGVLAAVLFVVLAQAATYRRIQKLDFMAALKNRA